MNQVLTFQPMESTETGPRPATIVAHDPDQDIYEVIPKGCTTALSARAALDGSTVLDEGDRVLITGTEPEGTWILGVIERKQRPEQDRLVLRDRQGRLLFEHDPATGRSVVYPEAGDLELAVPDGGMNLTSKETLRISSDECVEIASEHLRVNTRQADLVSGTTRLFGKRLSGRIGRASMIYDSLETRAGRLYTRAREAYTSIEELMHVRAGRFWAAVTETLHLKGKRTSIKADERVRIDGDRIDLG